MSDPVEVAALDRGESPFLSVPGSTFLKIPCRTCWRYDCSGTCGRIAPGDQTGARALSGWRRDESRLLWEFVDAAGVQVLAVSYQFLRQLAAEAVDLDAFFVGRYRLPAPGTPYSEVPS